MPQDPKDQRASTIIDDDNINTIHPVGADPSQCPSLTLAMIGPPATPTPEAAPFAPVKLSNVTSRKPTRAKSVAVARKKPSAKKKTPGKPVKRASVKPSRGASTRRAASKRTPAKRSPRRR